MAHWTTQCVVWCVQHQHNKIGDMMSIKDIQLDDYPYVVRWGKMMGSSRGYIDNQVRLACAQKAPATALYISHDGKWVTLDDLTSPRPFKDMGLPVPERFNHGVTIGVTQWFDTEEARDLFEADVVQRLSGVPGVKITYA